MLEKSLETYSIIIRQMLEVSDYLTADDGYSLRIAIILADNLCELIVQEKVDEIFVLDYKMEIPVKEKQAIDREFDKKIALLFNKKLIEEQEHKMLQVFHEVRNEAFHNCNFHYGLSMPLCKLYLKYLGEIFKKLYHENFSFSNADLSKSISDKYALEIENDYFNYDVINKIIQFVNNRYPRVEDGIKEILKKDCLYFLDCSIKSVSFYLDNLEGNKNVHYDEVVKICKKMLKSMDKQYKKWKIIKKMLEQLGDIDCLTWGTIISWKNDVEAIDAASDDAYAVDIWVRLRGKFYFLEYLEQIARDKFFIQKISKNK